MPHQIQHHRISQVLPPLNEQDPLIDAGVVGLYIKKNGRSQPFGADLPLNRYGMAALAVMPVRLGSAATAAACESAPYGCAISIPPHQVPLASHR